MSQQVAVQSGSLHGVAAFEAYQDAVSGVVFQQYGSVEVIRAHGSNCSVTVVVCFARTGCRSGVCAGSRGTACEVLERHIGFAGTACEILGGQFSNPIIIHLQPLLT